MLDKRIARCLKITALITSVAAVICLFIDWRLSVGILSGLLGVTIYTFILNSSLTRILDNGNGFNQFAYILGLLLRLVCLALPLLFGVLYPQVSNIIAAFGAEMTYRIVVYVSEGKKPQKEVSKK